MASKEADFSERDLEIEVHQLDAGDLEQPEILLVEVKTVSLGEEVDKPSRSDGGDERERERNASELGKDPRRRDREAPEDAVRASRDDRVREEGSEDCAQECGDSRQDGGVDARLDDVGARQVAEVVEREGIVGVQKRADPDDHRRQDQKEADVGEVRNCADPVERKPPAAQQWAADAGGYSRTSGDRQAIAASQCAWT